jgi:hypothetical protein
MTGSVAVGRPAAYLVGVRTHKYAAWMNDLSWFLRAWTATLRQPHFSAAPQEMAVEIPITDSSSPFEG